MPILHSPESAYAQEAAKWEMFPNQYSPTPGRPFVQQDYPKMLHMGGHDVNGRRAITHHVVVGSPREEQEQIARGYFVRQEDAIARVEQQDLEIATAAAEENFRVQRMGELARREATAVIDAAGEHLPTMPETPIRRVAGWPRKTAAAVAQE
jgi:hypothetical protein